MGLESRVRKLVRGRLAGGGKGSLEVLGEGDFCAAYLLDDYFVVRVAKHADAAEALRREACLLPKIAPLLPAPVPAPVYAPAQAEDDVAFSVHERLGGEVLTRTLWLGRSEPERAELAARLGELLRALHDIDPATARGCGLETVDHAGRVAALRARLREAPRAAVAPPLRDELDACFAEYVEGGDAWSYWPALLHADVAPGHVLVDPERRALTGVIDWGDAGIGDPARDFIFVYEDWGSDFLDAVLRGYEAGDPARLLRRVHLHYLADQLEWTLRAHERGRGPDVVHGLTGLARGLADFRSEAR